MISDQGREDLLDLVSQWAAQHVDADSLEEAEQTGLEAGRIVEQAVAQEGVTTSIAGSEEPGSSIDCECGGSAKMVNRRERTLVTICGEVKAARRYYHCPDCGAGWAPWDRAQGLTQRQFTPAVKALVAELASLLSYSETVAVMERMRGLRIEESSAEQIVAEVGGRARADQRQQARRILAGELSSQAAPRRLYLGVDGAHAHIDGAWHEVKHVVAQVEGQQRWYDAAREPAEQFGERVYALAARLGVEDAEEVVMIGDGAEWIWNLVAMHFPDAVQILDYYHACEHIHEVAEAHYGEDDQRARRWATAHKRKLLEEGPEPLLRALTAMRPESEEAEEVIRRTWGYVRRHRERMRYPQFRARGLSIGSGPVEAACKVITGQRLKRAGMRWSDAGADHVLALRCLVKSQQQDRIRQYARAA
ncbi:MAG: ISKra4 family transposase [Armatimonadota bacterium]